MSQTATETLQTHATNLKLNAEPAPRLDLKKYPRTELTPAIGLSFEKDFKLSTILKKPQEDKEAFFKALAYEISLNGLAVFPTQTDLTAGDLEEIAELLQKFSGSPQDGGHHIHPLQQDFDTEKKGGNVFHIGGQVGTKRIPDSELPLRDVKIASAGWHSDITSEKRPPSYALFQVNTLPRTGGDTLFVSNYALYDKLTPQFQQFLEGLTATHSGAKFHDTATKFNFDLFAGPRGAPENVGLDFTANHPVIRTNPLTNLKALYVNPGFTQYIDQLTFDESKAVLDYLFRLQAQSHDAIVRHKWVAGDLAIWDNRSTSHTATGDYGTTTRKALRATVVGEIPYFDPASISRKQYNELHPQRLDLPEIQL